MQPICDIRYATVLKSPLLSNAATSQCYLTVAAVEDIECGRRLSESEHTLHGSRQAQQRLQQQLAECKAKLEEASERADTAHSEALSYLSKVRQQDRQAQLDRSMCQVSPT